MKSLLPFSFSLLAFAFFINVTHAQLPIIEHKHEGGSSPLDFIENKNQWDESVLFKTSFEGASTLFIQRQGFTILMTDPSDLEKIHLAHKESAVLPKDLPIHQHAYKVEFLGSTPSEGRALPSGRFTIIILREMSNPIGQAMWACMVR